MVTVETDERENRGGNIMNSVSKPNCQQSTLVRGGGVPVTPQSRGAPVLFRLTNPHGFHLFQRVRLVFHRYPPLRSTKKYLQ